MINADAWHSLQEELKDKNITLVAVSKTKPAQDIQALYDIGQRHFGENYVQELTEKQLQLPGDIQWHYIGHLQSNKVKYIAPFVHLIHAVDSFKLLQEINKNAAKHNRVIDVLLQAYVAIEETKFGMDETEIIAFMDNYEAQKASLPNVRICGLMGMASFSDDMEQVRHEFKQLHTIFGNLKKTYFLFQEHFNTCSMGMTSDYKIAIEEGSTMVRIGSMLFGSRN